MGAELERLTQRLAGASGHQEGLTMTKLQLAGAAMSVLMAGSLGAGARAGAAEPAKPAVDTARITDAVKADVAQNVIDFNAHDADKIVSHDGPDVVQTAHGQTRRKMGVWLRERGREVSLREELSGQFGGLAERMWR